MIIYTSTYFIDEGDVLLVNQIYVEPKYQGQGFGLELLKELKRIAKEINCTAIFCATSPNNKAMIRLLEDKLGTGSINLETNFYFIPVI